MNKLYEQMNSQNNMQGFWEQVNQLKQKMGGDPNEHIQRMLNSGQITQSEYNRAVQKAEQLRRMFGK